MTDPHRPAPRFGYTVDENLLPHRRVARPAAVWVAMGLLPVLVLLGGATIVVVESSTGGLSMEFGSVVQAAVLLALGLATLETLLWRGLAESRVVVFAFTAAGVLAEAQLILGGVYGFSLTPDEAIPPVYLVLLAALGLTQLLAVTALVAALCRREVGDWFKTVRRFRFERRGHPW